MPVKFYGRPTHLLNPTQDGVYVDLQQYRSAACGPANPIDEQIIVSGAAIDPRATRPLTSADIVSVAPATATGTIADVTGNSAAQQLGNNACKAAVIRALAANTGNIRVGDSNVSASRGAELAPGDSIYLNISNTNLVYVYGVSPDKWSVTFVN